jgi:hypothetical protein
MNYENLNKAIKSFLLSYGLSLENYIPVTEESAQDDSMDITLLGDHSLSTSDLGPMRAIMRSKALKEQIDSE